MLCPNSCAETMRGCSNCADRVNFTLDGALQLNAEPHEGSSLRSVLRQMRKVCILSADISRTGGTERLATVIASQLAVRGFSVCILSMINHEAPFFPLHPAVRLHSLHMEKFSANFSDLRIWWRLRKFVQEEAIERIVDIDLALSYYSIPAAWKSRARVFSWEMFHLGINVGGWPQRLRRQIARHLAAGAAASVVTLSQKDRNQYLTRLTCRAPVVHIPPPMTIAHQKPSELDSKVVLAAGHLVPQKGFDLLLTAWAVIAQRHPQWRLRIVGSGAQKDILKSMSVRLNIVAQVDFVPQTPDMTREYLTASIYALSSRFEGYGLVLVEAKSFGLPVVSFDCDCGPSEIVRHEVDGLLVPPEDVGAFAAGLDRLIKSAQDREAFGKSALQDRRHELSRVMPLWERLLA